MKIGIVTTWFERGAAYVSRQYADVLRNAGHEVFVFARGGESYAQGDPNWDFDWVHWGRKSLLRDSSGIDLKDFSSWLTSNSIDLVLFNEQWTWEPVLLCRELGIKTVAYIDYYKERDVSLFGAYDGLICNTERHYSVFKWHPGAIYVPWGTDVDTFKPGGKFPALVDDQHVTFFHSAGMSPVRKGTDFLLRAFEHVKGNARLIIHSQIDLADKMPELSELIKRECKSGRLELISKTISAPGLYHMGDIYVYPSRLDGIGLTVCEAMACGLPAIVPDNGPMNEFVPSDKCGKKVQIDRLVARYDGYYWPQCWTNIKALTHAMQYYVDHRSEVEACRAGTRGYVMEYRDWAKNTSTLCACLEHLEEHNCSETDQRCKTQNPIWTIGSNLKRNLKIIQKKINLNN